MTRSLTDTAPEATTQTNAPATDALAGFHGLVGRSAPMQALFERIRRVAPYDVPVLIVGETGTGKTRVARVLHELSWRRAGPFAVLSCGALPPDLLRRGLDAQEPGSSWRRTRGDAKLLDGLRGGTLLLDELGDLAPDVQAQLGQVAAGLARLPAGSDVRLVATTHQDLLAAVREGRFRPDLYYQLRRAVLVVPPLRERLEDLPLLVEHVRRTTNVRHGVAIDGVTDGALHHLAAFPWPGNVLELEAVLEEAMLLQGHGWLGADSLALSGSGATPVRPATPGPASSVLDRAVRQRLALDLAAEPGGVSTGRFARACAVSLTLARRDLGALVGQGRLRRIGRGRAVHYVVA